MASHRELALLLSAANFALLRSLDDGDEKDYNGEWLNSVSMLDHAQHAHMHIDEVIACAIRHSFGIEEDLDHAIFRLVAIKALLIQQRMIKETGN